jgi:hypothetical protein
MRGSLQSALAGHRAYDQTDITSLQKASSSIRLRSMSGSGHASRMFNSGSRLWPPASSDAPPLASAFTSIASLSGRRAILEWRQ